MTLLLRQRWVAVVALAGSAIATLFALDRSPPPLSPGGGRATATRAGGPARGRVLMVILDGLRYETSMDSVTMPTLARLRRSGASARVETVFEGFSIPAMRAAFTGRADAQLINVIRNFRVRALPTASLFTELESDGRHAVVIGDDAFVQFGRALSQHVPPESVGDQYARDAAREPLAMRMYRDSSWSLVILHINSTDWRAHEYGIARAEYRAAYAAVDSVVARVASARRPEDHLVVMGDHGHDPRGEHKTGLDLPTAAIIVGPRASVGAVAAPLPIAAMHPVLAHLLGLPVVASPALVSRLSVLFRDRLRAGVPAGEAVPGSQRAVGRVALILALLGVFLGCCWQTVRAGNRAPTTGPAAGSQMMIVMIFAAELAAQRLGDPALAVFPILAIVVALRGWSRGTLPSIALGVLAVCLFSREWPGADGVIPRAPLGAISVGTLYVVGIFAKSVVFAAVVSGARQRALAVAVAIVVSVIGLRVWDEPIVFLAATCAFAIASWRTTVPAWRRICGLASAWCLFTFTHQLPLYQYAWADLLIGALVLLRPEQDDPWVTALVVSGTFALTSGWQPGGIEWGFLYRTVPAYLVEFRVGWFAPLIAAKTPLLLLITVWTLRWWHSSALVPAALSYLAVRVSGAVVIGLADAPMAEVWPVAEQAGYALLFAIAALLMTRSGPATSGARPAG
ncbi:MAG: alkaline phosphatase family protein [Gemmatimonadaceae bacterium]|nr:alkaline phosphatase family protein [Gemmatimonadaceae bacterium]